MPKQEIQQKPEAAPVVKLYRPDPIRRSRARDYSHWQQAVQVELKTDTTQRFLERNFNQTNETLQYLDYMLVILRDDAFAKPLSDELGAMFASFIKEAKATVSKLKASAESTTLPFAVQSTTYDNARTYEAVLLSGNSVDMLAAIVELDHLSMMIDTARGKRVISTFDRKNLLEQWVDTLTKIVRRVRTISSQVRDRNNELRKEREERQQKEPEARNRERARQEQARSNARRNAETVKANEQDKTPEKGTPVAEPENVRPAEGQAVEAAPADTGHDATPNDSDKVTEQEEATVAVKVDVDAGAAGDQANEPEPEAELTSPENTGETSSAEKEEKNSDSVADESSAASSSEPAARRTKRSSAKS